MTVYWRFKIRTPPPTPGGGVLHGKFSITGLIFGPSKYQFFSPAELIFQYYASPDSIMSTLIQTSLEFLWTLPPPPCLFSGSCQGISSKGFGILTPEWLTIFLRAAGARKKSVCQFYPYKSALFSLNRHSVCIDRHTFSSRRRRPAQKWCIIVYFQDFRKLRLLTRGRGNVVRKVKFKGILLMAFQYSTFGLQ